MAFASSYRGKKLSCASRTVDGSIQDVMAMIRPGLSVSTQKVLNLRLDTLILLMAQIVLQFERLGDRSDSCPNEVYYN